MRNSLKIRASGVVTRPRTGVFGLRTLGSGARDGRRKPPSSASRRLSAFGLAKAAPPLWFASSRSGLLPAGPPLADATFKVGAALVLCPPVPVCCLA
jgi:hypothetical protein